MPRAALVLSGGGAKGAFQLMAEKYARVVKGYEWDVIAGVSVGALNGTMLAMKQYHRLDQLWRTITQDQVFTGGFNAWSILKLLFGAKSVCDNAPLWRLLQSEIDVSRIQVDLRIGAVSLQTGEYVRFTPGDDGFERAILASTAIPIIFPPIDVSPAYPDMVDGGVRNISPLGDVLDSDPEEVVVINCSPSAELREPSPLRNALDIGTLALETAMNEIFVTDVREFLRINLNVLEAEAAGVTLHNENGKPFKYYKAAIIEPDEPLGDTLDFSPEAMERRMEAGWEKAKQVLGE